MKTYQEYFENYPIKFQEKLFNFFIEKEVSGEKEYYEWENHYDWFKKYQMFEIKQYVKEFLIPKIKIQRMDNKKRRNIVFDGLHDYNWFGYCPSLKSCVCRSGRWTTLKDVLEESLFEYISITNEDKKTLNVNAMTYEEVVESGLFESFNPETIALNVKKSFWEKFNIKQYA